MNRIAALSTALRLAIGALIVFSSTYSSGATARTRLDYVPSHLVRDVQRMFGRRCDWPRMAVCYTSPTTRIDFETNRSGTAISTLSIVALAVTDRESQPKLHPSSKSAALKIFAYLFPDWPGAGRWLDAAYDRALRSVAPMDVPNTNVPDNQPMNTGPVESTALDGVSIRVHKDETVTGRDETYVFVEL